MSPLPARLSDLVERQPELGPVAAQLDAALNLLIRTFAGGGTVYVAGNGGSAADAEHIVGELMKGMERRRPVPVGTRTALAAAVPPDFAEDAAYLADRLELALRAVSLTSQTSLLTAVANDTAADMAIAQQVNGYGRPGDTFWALSTSGRSRNMVLGAIAARAAGVGVLALTGDPGQPLGDLADVWVKVPAREVARAKNSTWLFTTRCARRSRRSSSDNDRRTFVPTATRSGWSCSGDGCLRRSISLALFVVPVTGKLIPLRGISCDRA